MVQHNVSVDGAEWYVDGPPELRFVRYCVWASEPFGFPTNLECRVHKDWQRDWTPRPVVWIQINAAGSHNKI